MKIIAVLLKLGQTRVIISPMSPKITAKREKRAREREREKKRLKKKKKEKKTINRRSLKDPFSERPGFHKSRYIYIYIYIYIYLQRPKLCHHRLGVRTPTTALIYFSFFSFSLIHLELKKTNTFIRARGSLENRTRFQIITVKIYTRF